MQASVGDTLTVSSLDHGEADRHGTITEIHGYDGEPPYLVRWLDEHESVFFPAAGTVVNHHPASGQPAAN